MEMARSFRGYSRDSDVAVDESEAAPLTPPSRHDGIESTRRGVPLSSNVARSMGRVSYPANKISDGGQVRASDQVEYDGTERVRVREQLSPVEEHQWKKAERDACMGWLGKGRLAGLEDWPKFFNKYEDAGKELKDGLVTVWTAFLTAEVLLISVAMQPFVTNIPNLNGWQFEVFGLLWMLVVVFDFMNFAITALFLGYLHAYPGKLTYMWLCNIGAWANIPSILVVVGVFMGLIAITFSSWVIYGARVGIICVVIEVLFSIFSVVTAIYLEKAAKEIEALH